MLNDEYFVLAAKAKNDMFLHSDADVTDLLDIDEYIDPTTTLKFKVDEEIASEPIAYDYLEIGISPIFSKKVKEIIEVFDYFPAMQFVKSVITFKGQVFSEDYFYMKVLNYISCMDKDNSNFKISKASGGIRKIKKLVLLEDVLKTKSLQQRLIFRLEESQGVYLFHESVVNAVTKVEPTGMKFHPVSQWNTYINIM